MAKRIDFAAWHGRCLFLLFAWSALALGSARPWAVAVATALALLAWVVGRMERRWTRPGPRLDGVGLGLVALTAFTFLQLVPLPATLVGSLSPRAHDLHSSAWVALGVEQRGGWFPLSLDPPATALAGLAMLAVTFTYSTVRLRLHALGGRAVLEPLVAAGVLVAVVFFFHQLAGWDKVYGYYVPRYVAVVPIPAPFLNTNHLAGALGFFAALSFGLAMSTVERYRRLTLILAGAMTGAGCLLTLSRGGILAFLAGQAVFLALRLAARYRGRGALGGSRGASPLPRIGAAKGLAANPLAIATSQTDTGLVPAAGPPATSNAPPADRSVVSEEVGTSQVPQPAKDEATSSDAIACSNLDKGGGFAAMPMKGWSDASVARKPEERRPKHLAWASLGVLLAVGAGSYVAYNAIIEEFEKGDTSKLDLARDAFAMAADHPLTGIGRGAYAAASAPYSGEPDVATHTHPENFIAQYVAEWGIPLGSLTVLGLLFVLGRAVLRPPIRPHKSAAIAAVFALLLQNTVDFGLELLGLAIPFMATLALVREAGRGGYEATGRRWAALQARLPRATWVLPATGTILVLALLYPWAAEHQLEVEADRFRLYSKAETYIPGILDDAREAFARHPADYYLPLQVGIHLARTGGGRPLPFWNQALRLHPCSSATHFAVATYFTRAGKKHWPQAVGQYALAVRCQPALLPHAASIVARMLPRFEDAAGFVLVAGSDPLPLWGALATAWESAGNAAAAAGADAAILSRSPNDLPARLRRARAALATDRPEEAWQHLGAAGPDKEREADYYRLGAKALAALNRHAEATAFLAHGLDRVPGLAIPIALADLHVSLGNYAAAEEALGLLEARSRTQHERTDAVVRRVHLLVRIGRLADALLQTRRALQIDPSRLDLWSLAANLAEQLGDIPGLVWALREWSRRQPKDQALRHRLQSAEARAAAIRLRHP